jgi:hypothetical protein
MKKGRLLKLASLFSFLVLGLSGCGEGPTPKIDLCELDYQKCIMKCKAEYIGEDSNWKEGACALKCKTFYAGCKTKEKSVEGYNYVKEKVTEDN